MAEPNQTIDLVLNGTHLAEVDTDDLAQLDRPLRSLAVAASPVLLEGGAQDCHEAASRLHTLGPRADLPLCTCRTPADADALLAASQEAAAVPAGTWVLSEVSAWPSAAQRRLTQALERLDASRLLGELGPRQLPRVVVVVPAGATTALAPDLVARLGFFKVRLVRQG